MSTASVTQKKFYPNVALPNKYALKIDHFILSFSIGKAGRAMEEKAGLEFQDREVSVSMTTSAALLVHLHAFPSFR